jgi:hypothetical protein
MTAATPLLPDIGPRWLNRLLPFGISFAVTCAFFINACAWLFACGCRALWAGADATCNIHSAGRHCPVCSHGIAGYTAMMAIVCAPQLVTSMRSSWSLPIRTILCLVIFPVVFAGAGYVLGMYEGYWR